MNWCFLTFRCFTLYSNKPVKLAKKIASHSIFFYRGTFCQDVFGNVSEYSMIGMTLLPFSHHRRGINRKGFTNMCEVSPKTQWEVGASNSTYGGEITPVKTHWFSNPATHVTSIWKTIGFLGPPSCGCFFRWRILIVGESHISFCKSPLLTRHEIGVFPPCREISFWTGKDL